MRNVVLGVCGGVAAYKALHVVRGLRESGAEVRVVPTASALHFVGAATFEALSGQPVATQVWDRVPEVDHVRLGQQADLVLVVPATANTLAKAAHGIADNLLTNILLTAHCPVLMAPAMHTEMWEHAATRYNVSTLRGRGVTVIEPSVGRLTGADSGAGRLPEPAEILPIAFAALSAPAGRDLTDVRLLVSAGGTSEPLDPVRFLTNRSSGKQGHAIAAAAYARGAEVTLVSSSLEPVPAGVHHVPVRTARELHEQMMAQRSDADVIVMSAAVSDFRPETYNDRKVKKSGAERVSLHLVPNPDILRDLVVHRSQGQFIVGFAAETGDENHTALEHARNKLRRKGCDLLVFNDVSGSGVFGRETNTVNLLSRRGGERPLVEASKLNVAHEILNTVVEQRRDASGNP